MVEVWVVNASPVILLAQVDLLHLLERLPDRMILPEAVAEEILAGPEHDAARRAVARGWATRQSVASIEPGIQEWGLGRGESAVIAVAKSMGDAAVAVLDDRLGRSAARAHNLPVLGTVGVIVRAKHAKLISRAAEALDALQQAGLYLNPAIVEAALKLTNET